MASPSSYNVLATGTGATSAIAIDLRRFKNGVGILVTIPVGTTATYNVEITGDDPTEGFTYWNLHDTLKNLSASANSNLAFPVTGIRLNVSAMTGPGPINMSIVQVTG